MNNKPTLVYYSPDCFTQVDDTVLCHLSKDFNVVWFYVYDSLHKNNMRYNPQLAKRCAEKWGVSVEVISTGMRWRDPRNILFYIKLSRLINSYNPGIVYACELYPFWLLSFPYIRCKNKIYGIHDVLPHYENANFIKKWILKKKDYFIKRKFDHLITFSPNQQKLLKEHFGKESEMVGMSYKYFGKPTQPLPPFAGKIYLLFFGIISHYKGLDLLIQTLEELRTEGVDNLQLTIAGKGGDWEECKPYIKTPEMYNLQVCFIDNQEIPNLMNTHHFLVLPYRTATQSGPLVAALGYSLPIVAPMFGCFIDTLNDDTAIFYPQGKLKEALKKVSTMQPEEYEQMRTAMSSLREKYSEENIAANYINTFKKVLNQGE